MIGKGFSCPYCLVSHWSFWNEEGVKNGKYSLALELSSKKTGAGAAVSRLHSPTAIYLAPCSTSCWIINPISHCTLRELQCDVLRKLLVLFCFVFFPFAMGFLHMCSFWKGNLIQGILVSWLSLLQAVVTANLDTWKWWQRGTAL